MEGSAKRKQWYTLEAFGTNVVHWVQEIHPENDRGPMILEEAVQVGSQNIIVFFVQLGAH